MYRHNQIFKKSKIKPSKIFQRAFAKTDMHFQTSGITQQMLVESVVCNRTFFFLDNIFIFPTGKYKRISFTSQRILSNMILYHLMRTIGSWTQVRREIAVDIILFGSNNCTNSYRVQYTCASQGSSKKKTNKQKKQQNPQGIHIMKFILRKWLMCLQRLRSSTVCHLQAQDPEKLVV